MRFFLTTMPIKWDTYLENTGARFYNCIFKSYENNFNQGQIAYGHFLVLSTSSYIITPSNNSTLVIILKYYN